MKISIITATFNSASTLRDTIESVVRQTYDNYEYIIIDGKSTDGTINIIKKYEPQLQGKLKWISEKDKGIYDAMNKGISLATGDVIGILNSDDFYTTNDILQNIVTAFQQNDIDAVYGDIHFVSDSDLSKCVRYYSSGIFKRKLMRLGFMPAHPSFYIKKECINKIGLYDTSYKIAADFDFLLRAIYINNIKTLYLKKDFVTMRMGVASTSGISSHRLIMKEHLKAFRKYHICTNPFLLSLRYIYKIYELLVSKISHKERINTKSLP